jgi:SNF2 family DNA or RNA helicase
MRRAAGHDKYGSFLDTGLGKTEVNLHEFIDSGLDQQLVICPNSLKRSWADAIVEWCPSLSSGVTIWPEPPDSGTATFIVNYEMLIYDRSFNVVEAYMKRAPTFMTIDEGHRTKNFNAKTTKMVHALAARAAIRRELTATPMVQNVMDLWSQMRFLGKLEGMNPYVFRNRFAVMGGWMSKQVMGIKQERMVELQELLDSCSFRASKDDWSDLPPRIQMPPREFEMTKEQNNLYKQMLDEFLIMVGDEAVAAEMVITQLMKLQQISRGFVMDEDGEPHDLIPSNENPALRVLIDTLEDIKGKTLIFCHYRHSVSTVFNYLKAKGHDHAILM